MDLKTTHNFTPSVILNDIGNFYFVTDITPTSRCFKSPKV